MGTPIWKSNGWTYEFAATFDVNFLMHVEEKHFCANIVISPFFPEIFKKLIDTGTNIKWPS